MLNRPITFWLGLILFSSAFLLAANMMLDTDAWMHLNLGRVIWENGGIPENESFVYTAKDMPFLYTSWLFSLLYYTVYQSFDVYGVILLKALLISSTFWFLYKDAVQRGAQPWVTLLVVVLFAILCRQRFVERPDTFMFLFLAISLYIVNRYYYLGQTKYLFLLPVIHLIWANMHSSVILLVAPYLSVIVGGGAYYWLTKHGLTAKHVASLKTFKILFLLLFVSLIAALANPNGYHQLFFGQDILNTNFYAEELSELKPPTWESSKITFLVIAIISLTLLLRFAQTFKANNKKNLDNYPSLVDLILLFPFVLASFTSSRFIYPLIIISAPIVSLQLTGIISHYLSEEKMGASRFFNKTSAAIAILSAILVAYFGTPFDVQRTGFAQDFTYVPEKALNFMDKTNIEGRVFNTFEWGGYIAWRDKDKRSVFVDPRGYIPPEHLEDIKSALKSVERTSQLQSQYGFESILTKYFPGKNKPADFYIDPKLRSKWALVYWDDSALLFLRRNGPYRKLIDEYEYKLLEPQIGFDGLRKYLNTANTTHEVINELLRNISQTNSNNGKLQLGFVYAYTAQYDEAEKYLLPFLEIENDHLQALTKRWLGYIYHRKNQLALAFSTYKDSLALENDAETVLNAGIVSYQLRDRKNAAKYLEEYSLSSPLPSAAYKALKDIYAENNETQKIAELEGRQQENISRKNKKILFAQGMKAQSMGRLDLAESTFLKLLSIDPTIATAYTNLGFIMQSKGNFDNAVEYHKKALALDPRAKKSLYGLGLACMKLNKSVDAINYFKSYVEMVPNGYWARQAKSYIKELERQ